MNPKLTPVLWMLIITLVGQGILPGAVVCFEETGQIEVETVEIECCYLDAHPDGRTAVVVLTTPTGSPAGDFCGPCTDTPILPLPITNPARKGSISASTAPCTAAVLDPVAIETEIYSASEFVVTDAALIPINTTILLI